ncbi:MAG: succinyl-diaminopimelate desuccinylase [Bifidobacteriaceae bacterium]|jgi:succinyl-diaminopimelate desuccinylase|nr:succinyl-diaminopimelate desuccinylase [Bifidobacteriaceae bacterium]MCI1979388.1 succinyl-diaminopimelate desuccinylase [Bifidobacteriaceae bacterium]
MLKKSLVSSSRSVSLKNLLWETVAAFSVSDHETALADVVEAYLRDCPHLEVMRNGDTVIARTHLYRSRRIILAGHIDTVPVIDNFPPRWLTPSDPEVLPEVAAATTEENADVLWGRGSTDMKASVAVFLYLAATLTQPEADITYIFYDHEEVVAEKNGLRRVVADNPDWIQADFAIVGEPTSTGIEAGCNGSIRFDVITHGVAAHSARSWKGVNAIHRAADILNKLNDYEARTVTVDGLEYREGLNATLISGGKGTNIIPDECRVHINYRFAPDKTLEQAEALMVGAEGIFAGYDYEMKDESAPARPGMSTPMAVSLSDFVRQRVGKEPLAKLGWTDVARFSQLGVPAVNFGAGDPLLAHKHDEQVALAEVIRYTEILEEWLTSGNF